MHHCGIGQYLPVHKRTNNLSITTLPFALCYLNARALMPYIHNVVRPKPRPVIIQKIGHGENKVERANCIGLFLRGGHHPTNMDPKGARS